MIIKNSMRTLRPAIATLALALVAPACANRPTADAEAEAPGHEGSVATYASTNGEKPTFVFGTLTVLEEQRDEQGEPQYTEIQYAVDSVLLDGCRSTVYFPYDSAKVGQTAELKLDQVAQCLQEPPLDDEPIAIVGHADERGTDEYNRELGLDRANSVAQALASEGIDRSRIETYSRGEYAADEPEYWDDRRVVIRLAK